MVRRWLLFIAALIALPGSLAAVFATAAERDFVLRGYVDAAVTTDLPYRLPRMGVNAELMQYSADELREQLDLMQQAHVTWIRQVVSWDEIEPEPGQYDWDAWDHLVETLNDYPDFRPVVVFMNTPAWARPAPLAEQRTAPPDDPASLAEFARMFAARYGDTVDYYQIWDEPNLDDAWGGSDPRPADYAALLQAAYTAVHSADRVATVIAAALAPTIETGGQNISDLIYLEALYALGADAYFDAAAAKPYGFNLPPDDRTIRPDVLNFSRMVALREIMVRYGDGKKALWASDYGWNALPETWEGEPSIWGSVTAQQQADYTLQALARADREWAWLGAMVLHQWQPDAPTDDPQWGFAVIDAQNQPTALWQALTMQPPETARDGVFHPITPFARYSGVWTFGQQGADIGWLETSDSQLEFDFTGRDVSLWLREDDYVAFLYPLVDGQPANATPHDSSGNAYIFLQSDTLKPELNAVPAARHLQNTAHTLRVIADRGWDRWALAGYAVSSGNLAEPYDRQIVVGWFTALVAALAVMATGRQIPWRAVLRPAAGAIHRLSDTGQIFISAITSLALMIGMLLTWGDGVPALFRREALQTGAAIVLTGGLVIIQPGFLLSILASAVLVVVFYHRLQTGLMLTLFYAPFFLFPLKLNDFAFPMSEICLLLTAGAWVLRLLAQWGRVRQSAVSQLPGISFQTWLLRLQALDWAVLLWVVLGVVSLSWSQYLSEATTELRTMVIEPALFYAIFRTLTWQKRDLLRIVDALLLAGGLVCLIGLFLYFRCVFTDVCGGVIQAEGGTWRLASVYGSPNNVGLWLGRCIPFALAYVLVMTPANGRELSSTTQRPVRRIVASITLVLMLMTTVLTQSAGAILFGIPAGMALVIVLYYGRRAWLPAGGLLAAGSIVVLLLAQVSSRFAGLFLSERGTNFIRLRVWESSLEMIRNHPITGLGLDQFLYAYSGQYIRPDAIADKDLSHPHNFLLDFWLRLGIGGVILLIGLQVAFWRTAWQAFRRVRQDAVYRALIMGAMGSMAALLAHGVSDNSVFVKDLAYIFVFILNIVAVISIQPNARSIDEDPD